MFFLLDIVRISLLGFDQDMFLSHPVSGIMVPGLQSTGNLFIVFGLFNYNINKH